MTAPFQSGRFNRRIAVQERGGRFFAEDLEIRLLKDRQRLDLGSREALGLTGHTRLHRCTVCESWFLGHFAAAVCTPDCATKAHQRRSQTARIERQKQRELARQAGLFEVPCAWCGTRQTVERSKRRYCSQKCRQAAYRARKKPALKGQGGRE